MRVSEAPPALSVSVVVCGFTQARAEQLLAALESLRGQTVRPAEVIVVVDHNPELLAWLQERVADAIVVPNAEGSGLAGARNTGLAEARGDVVAFLDDDAVAAPTWIEQLAAAYRDPDVVGVGGAVLPSWEGERPRWLPEEFQWVVGCSYRGLPVDRAAVRNLIGCNMSFRRGVFGEVGGFAHKLGRVGSRPLGCEETELCIRIGRHAPDRPIVYDPAVAVHHHVPRARATWRYFLSRCHAEGRSKAEVTRLAGRDRGLARERSYAARTLPAGIWGGIRAACAGRDVAGLARAAAIVAGLAATTAGYLLGVAARLTAAPEARRQGGRP